MKHFFAYIRVSTVKQGERGSSLQEQRAAIEEYAKRHDLAIFEWIEERETAAKRGRQEFMRMLSLLREGKTSGVIIHKIDRGVRNLRDWADLGELIDLGVEVHCASEGLDLASRGGRLSADIQAVVASDYIRNLRDEVLKGFYGRLRQGIYPLPAPLGYTDQGAGVPKAIDPIVGALIHQVFQLYATGGYSLRSLLVEMTERGLRTRSGKPLNINILARILRNEFYIGLIHIRRRGEHFEGKHVALVSKSLFDRVQRRLDGKIRSRGWKHHFVYRLALRCATSHHALVPERQKGHVYYRCHLKDCKTIVREDSISEQLATALEILRLSPSELTLLEAHLRLREDQGLVERTFAIHAARLGMNALRDRERRLTDALIDGLIDKEMFETRRTTLLLDKVAAKENLARLEDEGQAIANDAREKLELLKRLSFGDATETEEEKLDLLKQMTSNLSVQGKEVVVTWLLPYRALGNRAYESFGPPHRGRPRTFLTHDLCERFITEAITERADQRERNRGSNDNTSDTCSPIPQIDEERKLRRLGG